METTIYFQLSGYYGNNTYFYMLDACKEFNLSVTELKGGWYSTGKNAFTLLHNRNLAIGGYSSL